MAEKGLEFLLKQTEVVATVSFDASTNVVTYVGHGMSAGDPIIFASTGAVPAGMTEGQIYYIGAEVASSFKIYDTKASAIAESGTVDFTNNGSGTLTAQKLITSAGMRSTAFTLDGESVEITTKDSAGWQALKEGSGITKMSISASGVFQDEASAKRLQVQAINNTLDTFTIRFESGDEYWGLFKVLSAENAGEYNGEVTYSISLESSGVITPVDNV